MPPPAQPPQPTNNRGHFGPENDRKRFQLIDELGGGMQAKVFKCTYTKDAEDCEQYNNEQAEVQKEVQKDQNAPKQNAVQKIPKPYAVKCVQKKQLTIPEDGRSNEDDYVDTNVELILKEAQILEKLSHPKIVNLVDYFQDDQQVYVVMEYVSEGDLFEPIAKSRGLTEVEAKYVFSQLLDALSYMHNQNVVHRDLKPENILVNQRVTISAGDTKTTLYDFKIADQRSRISLLTSWDSRHLV